MRDHKERGGSGPHPSRRERAKTELKVFLGLTVYFTLFLGSFTIYRRLILAESGINYLHYGIALIQGILLAKLLLIAEAMGISRRFRRGPLAVNVLLLSAGATGFVMLADVFEHVLKGLAHGQRPVEVLAGSAAVNPSETLERMIVLILAMIPLFAFLEMGKSIGFRRLGVLLFARKRAPHRRSSP